MVSSVQVHPGVLRQIQGVGNVANMGEETRQDQGQDLLDHITDEKQDTAKVMHKEYVICRRSHGGVDNKQHVDKVLKKDQICETS